MELVKLPPEMIGLVALYLPHVSIRALKCVNKYVNTCLDTKRVWKRLLFYPERYYKSDIISQSEAAALVEVLWEISVGNLGQWEGYYKLQRARLSKWQNKQCHDFVSIIPFPSFSIDVQEMVDDCGRRWFFVLTKFGKLYIWDITSVPRRHGTVRVSCRAYSISLLHHGYVMVHDDKIIYVYKFAKPDYRLLLYYQFIYNEDKIMDRSTSLPTNPCNYRSCVVNDLFIACDANVQVLSEMAIHVWDVSSGRKLAKVGLLDGCTPRKFVGASICHVDIASGHSLNIVVNIKYSEDVYITVFNTKTFVFTCCLRLPSVDILEFKSAHIYEDIVCCVSKSHVLVYTLPSGPTQDGQTSVFGRLLKTFERTWFDRVDFKHSKMMIGIGTGVLVVSLARNDLPEVQVTFNILRSIFLSPQKMTFIEPNLLIVWDYFGNLMVINTLNSETLNTWENINHMDFVKYYSLIVYPSMFAVRFGNVVRFYAL